MQQCFILDLNRCTGCHACVIACKNENELPADANWRQVIQFNQQRIPHLPVISYSIACNHCIDAPCKANCPALAIQKDEDSGAVTIDPQKCMGCNYCQWVCPYDATVYNKSKGIMEKCTFCSHREDDQPACVSACPTGALSSGDYQQEKIGLNGNTPDIWRTNIEPAIILKPLREGARIPKADDFTNKHRLHNIIGKIKRKKESSVSLKTEWPLLLFTMTAPLMVASFVAFNFNFLKIPPMIYALLGLAAMALSTIHLGKKFRFSRAILNWKKSWLSREIIFFSAFFISSAFYLLLDIQLSLISYVIIALGAVALFSFDKVYLIDSIPNPEVHSASSTLTGLYLTGVFMYNLPLWVILGLLKFFLYFRRKFKKTATANGHPIVTACRLLFGLVVPGFLLILSPEKYKAIIIASILLSEFLDRMEFYLDLEFMRPQTKAHLDLEHMLSKQPE